MTGASHSSAYKGVLTLGFLAFAAAVAVAHASPASGYELSIYRATPAVFWLGIGVGFVAALSTLFGAESRRLVDGAMLLAVGCTLAIAAIPLLRSYAFYGAGDSLSHLGWAREMRAGVIEPSETVYPGTHLIGVFLGELTGLDLTTTLQFVPELLFPLVYVVAVPLCVAALTESRWAVPVGLVVGLLFLPINEVSVHIVQHPSSQAILLVPFVLLLTLRYLSDDDERFPLLTPWGLALAVGGIGLLFIHPQETMTFLSLLAALAVVGALARSYAPDGALANHRPLGVHAVVLGVGLVAWITQHGRAIGRIEAVVTGLLTAGVTTGDGTETRGESLVDLGGSFLELFVKLFGVTTLFCVLAAAVVAYHVLRSDDSSPRTALVPLLAVGLLPPMGIFVIIFLADQGDHYFRFLGFITAVAGIVGGVGIVSMIRYAAGENARQSRSSWGSIRRSAGRLRPGALALVVVALVLLLAGQLVAIHASPYMYQPNKQVTEADITGHEVLFEHHDGETPVVGLRAGEGRFVDAHYGTETAAADPDLAMLDGGVTGEQFRSGLPSVFDEDRYLVVQEHDVLKEVVLYDELRFPREGFERLDRDDRIDRVQQNGEVRLYRINEEPSDDEDEESG
ncbi:hypothetical protein U4E84_02465 [Halorubrum sp. AD140]|uniref:hypothetical protein n=1 Tax=Halorubrum sp. AD140 TaxID=3050073 RepID=UPI002ACCDF4E|nr:hypothetical protein [Halorubrum sp. AD140]MDZ5810219.1 hypothetical protein [Halorubrum sp. AD140]